MGKLVIVIFGASGDLTKRKLMPALYSLFYTKRLKGEFAVLGASRTSYTDESFRTYINEEIYNFLDHSLLDKEKIEEFIGHLYYYSMDPAIETGYPDLSDKIDQIGGEIGRASCRERVLRLV